MAYVIAIIAAVLFSAEVLMAFVALVGLLGVTVTREAFRHYRQRSTAPASGHPVIIVND